ncbi:MAG: hypothetical protein IJ767_05930 [Bacteroidaceae bacterium]|nr:hypothetical protein [Bacteroidaceae bacterium]
MMTRGEAAMMLGDALLRARRLGVTAADVERLGVLREYAEGKASGEKMEAVVMELCERWGMSRSGLFRYVQRMGEVVMM